MLIRTIARLRPLAAIIAAIVFGVIAQPTAAQSPQPQLPNDIHFEQLSVDDGLISSRTRAVVQDDSGFMWFATDQGVNRYDSQQFTLFSINSNDPRRNLGRNSILSLAKSQLTEDIWIGSEKLTRYDPILDQLESFELSGGKGILSIIEDASGFIWLGGNETGLIQFDPNTGLVVGKYEISGDENLQNETVYKLALAADGSLWFTTPSGVYSFNSETNSIELIAGTETIADSRISDLAFDSDGNVWIGTWEGLYHYDFDSLELIDTADVGFEQVHSLFIDSRNWLWIGSDKQGVAAHDLGTGEFRHYDSAENDPSQLAQASIFDIYEDKDHTLWFASHGFGLYRYNPNTIPFDLVLSDNTRENWLTGSQILALQDDTEGNIFVATDGGGLFKFDEAERTFAHFENDPDDPTSLQNNSVIGLARDTNGSIWLSGWGGGISRFNADTNDFLRLNSENSGLMTNNVFTLAVDKHNKLWASMWDHGIQVINVATGQVEQTIQGGTDGAIANINTMAILEASDGTMWFGGFTGVDQYFPETGKTIHYAQSTLAAVTSNSNATLAPGSLSSNITFVLHESSDGTIWAGTDSGLNRINPVARSVKFYTSSDGLSAGSVFGILEDADGDLWLSTSNGIALFRRDQNSFQSFGLSYAIQGKEFNRFSYLSAENGKMYFGGPKGFNYFDPIAVKQNATFGTEYDVHFTELLIDNERIYPTPDGVLQHAIDHSERIVLEPSNDVVSLRFAAPIYSHSDQVKYQYQLEGFDQTWTESSDENSFVTYTNLNPGEYQFNVRALTTFDKSILATNSIALKVTPRWYETTLFRASVVLIALGIGYAFYSVQVKSALRKLRSEQKARESEEHRLRGLELESLNGKLLKLNQEKDDLLGIVSHDLRNPLAATLLSLNFLTSNGEVVSAEKRQSIYDRLERSTQAAFQIAEKLVSGYDDKGLVLKTEPVVIKNVIDNICDEVQPKLRAKKIGLTQIWSIPESTKLLADPVTLRQVISNIISNSIKYSHKQTHILVSVLQKEQHEILIKVSDEGLGMSKDDLRNVFGKYSQLSARPTGGEDSVGLGLYNVKKLTELMGGTVTATSDGIGKGSTFTVALPIFDENV